MKSKGNKPANAKDERKVTIDLDALEPVYTNMVNIGHSNYDFVLNFVQFSPPNGKLVAKLVTSPQHAKAILSVLQDQITRYEATFGQMPEPKLPGEVVPIGQGAANTH